MSLRALIITILCLIFTALAPTTLWANWIAVGKADYNWMLIRVYTVSLYTENGKYSDDPNSPPQPVMISFDYAKPVEGKSFAITLTKEMASLGVDKKQSEAWLNELQNTLPDVSPNDRLSYIALPDRGYFILNDQVLEHQFNADFNRTFLNIWLSGKTNFASLKDKLLGKVKEKVTETHSKQPAVVPMQEDDASPQIPPKYELEHLFHIKT